MRTLPSSFRCFSRPPPRLMLQIPTTTPFAKVNPSHQVGLLQRRYFFKPSSFDSLFAATTPLRQLSHTRVLPYPRSSVFDAIASVDRYPSFLPFVISATVSQRDQHELPVRATLKVGYDPFGIEENWESIVNASEEHGTIEARSVDVEQGDEGGIFEILKTNWRLHDLEDIRRQGIGIGAQTAVSLDVEVKFRSAIYDKLFAGVEEKVAGIMVGAFEKRLNELARS